MGFFSWECTTCGLSACSTHIGKHRESATTQLGEVVILFPNGDRVSGEYDGYGRVGDSLELDYDSSFELYHEACYTRAGRPNYESPAASAGDQGFFIEYERYADILEPQPGDED